MKNVLKKILKKNVFDKDGNLILDVSVLDFPIELFDENGNEIYYEESRGYWVKREYDENGNEIYYENSDGFWVKSEFDENGKQIYYERNNGYWSKREYDERGKKIYEEDSYGDWWKWEYDENGNRIYFENSDGIVRDDRHKGKKVKDATIEKTKSIKNNIIIETSEDILKNLNERIEILENKNEQMFIALDNLLKILKTTK